ncbi:MAG: hypothetical protein U1E15_03225 [Hyphomicrobiales bacterium]
MAASVYELIDREPCRIAVDVHPGISASSRWPAHGLARSSRRLLLHLASTCSRHGKPSCSADTAAEGDFVIAFTIPVHSSAPTRSSRFSTFCRPHRQPDTPVVLATSLGRPEEKVRIIRFDAFRAEDVDMLTLVMVLIIAILLLHAR